MMRGGRGLGSRWRWRAHAPIEAVPVLLASRGTADSLASWSRFNLQKLKREHPAAVATASDVATGMGMDPLAAAAAVEQWTDFFNVEKHLGCSVHHIAAPAGSNEAASGAGLSCTAPLRRVF